MKKCENCNFLTRKNDKYCRNCGVLISNDKSMLLNGIFTGFILLGIIFLILLFIASYLVE